MLSSLVTAFRQQYPKGSLVSDLTHVQEGQYVVRVMVRVDDLALATALAADSTLETAEDRALERALTRLALPGVDAVMLLEQDLRPVNATNAVSAGVSPAVEHCRGSVADEGANEIAEEVAEETEALDSTPLIPPPIARPAVSSEKSAPTAPTAPPPLTLVPTGVNGSDPSTWAEETTIAAELPLLDSPEPSNNAWFPAVPAQPSLDPRPAEPMEMAPALDADLLSLEGLPTPSIDLSDIIAQTDVELQRLGWTVSQGREFLDKTYGKRSRHDLTDEELLEFLLFLETQPSP